MRTQIVLAAVLTVALSTPASARFLQTDPIGYKDDLNLYTYVDNDSLNATDPSGETCVPADWGAYCNRMVKYEHLDARYSRQTRFFGAAAGTVSMLADLDMQPGIGWALGPSGATRAFLSSLSSHLETFNDQIATKLSQGGFSARGPALDKEIVHLEQTRAQEDLDSLSPSARAAVVSDMNKMMNPSGITGALSGAYTTDRTYQHVLDSVRDKLGRPIDYARQSDREAIGNALAQFLRAQASACPEPNVCSGSLDGGAWGDSGEIEGDIS